MRLQALFAAALVAVLFALGVALSPLGWLVVSGYAVVAVMALLVLAAWARARDGHDAREAHEARTTSDGRTCDCCTSTVFDPVEVR